MEQHPGDSKRRDRDVEDGTEVQDHDVRGPDTDRPAGQPPDGLLLVLREAPALVPMLLREVFGVDVPPFASIEVVTAGFTGKYEYKSDFARRYFREGHEQGQAEGRQEGRQEGRLHEASAILLALADRHGAVRDDLRTRVTACVDPERLRALAVEVASAPDRAAIDRLLAGLPPAAGRDD